MVGISIRVKVDLSNRERVIINIQNILQRTELASQGDIANVRSCTVLYEL
jgi:hypothetical protein